MNKISVIVPVYNTKRYLCRCVDGLLCQSYSDIEILLVENGSTDGCRELCDQYANKYPQIEAYHVANKGVSYARNIGMKNAKGDFLAFCDSDDYMPPYALKHMVEALLSEKADLCIGRYKEQFQDKETEAVDSFFEKSSMNMQDVIDTIGINRQWKGGGYVWNKMFRASVVRQEPSLQFDEKLDCYEDLKFALEFIKRTEKIIKINEVVYIYNKDNVNSISHMRYDFQSICKLKGLEEICEILETFPNGSRAMQSRKNQLLKMCTSFYGRLISSRSCEKKKSVKLLKEIVKRNAYNIKLDATWGVRHRVMLYIMKIAIFC